MRKILSLTVAALVLQACANAAPTNQSAHSPSASNNCLDYSGRDDVLSGGVKLIPITTPKGNGSATTQPSRYCCYMAGPA